jgi:hypothetical protein
MRILHAMESATDRNVMLDDLDVSVLDREVAARLQASEALARWAGRDETELIRVRPGEGINSSREVPDDRVGAAMAAYGDEVRRLLPYPLCTREMCPGGCQPRTRRRGEVIARELEPAARKHWEQAQGTVRVLGADHGRQQAETGPDVRLAYCTAVHLAVAKAAFDVPRRVDIRPQLMQAAQQAPEQ